MRYSLDIGCRKGASMTLSMSADRASIVEVSDKIKVVIASSAQGFRYGMATETDQNLAFTF